VEVVFSYVVKIGENCAGLCQEVQICVTNLVMLKILNNYSIRLPRTFLEIIENKIITNIPKNRENS